MAEQSKLEFALSQPPTDGVTRVRFLNSKRFLVVSSWDQTVRLYDVAADKMVARHDSGSPVLDCAGGPDPQTCVFGGLDQCVRLVDFNSPDRSQVLGRHEGAVRCVEFAPLVNAAISGSWDATCCVMDPRQGGKAVASRATLPGKVLAMGLQDWRLAVGSMPGVISVFDLRKFSSGPIEQRDSPLKHQMRALSVYPDNRAFVVGTIEGKCSIDCFKDTAGARKIFTFKCHRQSEGDTDVIYPVNCIAFHPVYGTMATGGCDGFVNVWDTQNQKKVANFRRYPTSISSVAFSPEGGLMAIAASYTFEEGVKDHVADAVFIRTIQEENVRPFK